MLAILSSLNAHSFPIFQPILMILVSKFMVHRALSYKRYLSLRLLSPLIKKHMSPCSFFFFVLFSFFTSEIKTGMECHTMIPA